MSITKIRQVVEQQGALVAFIPNPPEQDFHPSAPNLRGHMEVTALSFADEHENWTRGWSFVMKDGEGRMGGRRFLDPEELPHLRDLLRRWSDESVKLAFEYRSIEGIVFKKFQANQRITFLTPGMGETNGIDGSQLVEQVVAFLESSAKLWE